MRKQYRLTEKQLKSLMDAIKPEPVMFLSGGKPMFSSQQERANAAWQSLGTKLGFDGMSVQPVGSDPHDFSAESTEKDRP